MLIPFFPYCIFVLMFNVNFFQRFLHSLSNHLSLLFLLAFLFVGFRFARDAERSNI